MKNCNIFIIYLIAVYLSSCGIYSFTGASIPPGAKTVSVGYFQNKAANIQPILSQTFTENLKDIFLEQTNLVLQEANGDLAFSGYISKYEIKPIAIESNENAAKNRLTISVHVIFVNSIEKEKGFEQKFSRYRDYESTENINNIEEELINYITEEIIEDIFNKSIVNW
tara:strand:- start:243 stop:746 length:504 start_codon:yes stop_codon:yes gene_type:complete